jgi:hypothetical protein
LLFAVPQEVLCINKVEARGVEPVRTNTNRTI